MEMQTFDHLTIEPSKLVWRNENRDSQDSLGGLYGRRCSPACRPASTEETSSDSQQIQGISFAFFVQQPL